MYKHRQSVPGYLPTYKPTYLPHLTKIDGHKTQLERRDNNKDSISN